MQNENSTKDDGPPREELWRQKFQSERSLAGDPQISRNPSEEKNKLRSGDWVRKVHSFRGITFANPSRNENEAETVAARSTEVRTAPGAVAVAPRGVERPRQPHSFASASLDSFETGGVSEHNLEPVEEDSPHLLSATLVSDFADDERIQEQVRAEAERQMKNKLSETVLAHAEPMEGSETPNKQEKQQKKSRSRFVIAGMAACMVLVIAVFGAVMGTLVSGDPEVLETPSPTTIAPTSPPAECWHNLTQIAEIELALNDSTRFREYVLCPNTIFDMSVESPIVIRTNVLYRCGQLGRSEDNCVLEGGDIHVTSFSNFLAEAFDSYKNVQLEGITFRGASVSSLYLSYPGDMTFVDCVIEEHQSLSPVLLRYNPESIALDRTSSILPVLDQICPDCQLVVYTGGRSDRLNAPPPDGELRVTFLQTVFRNNSISEDISNESFRPGIISVEDSQVFLYLHECLFTNNLYGDSTSSYAISTHGVLDIHESCFLENDFTGDGPIRSPVFAGVGNFGTFDDNVICQFVTDDLGCVEFDQQTCPLS